MNEILRRASEFHNQGQLPKAEEHYRLILKSDPDQPDALALLGLLYAEQRLYEKGLLHIEHAIRSDPETALFRFYLGDILYDMGRHEEAEDAFKEALLRQPLFAEAHYKLATIYERQQRYDEALLHLHRAIQIKQRYLLAHVALSDIARKNNDYHTARDAAEAALRLDPDNLAAHIALALAFDFLNQEEKAIGSLKEALRIKPDFIEALDMLGVTYQNCGRYAEAKSTLLDALKYVGGTIEDDEGPEIPEEDYKVQHWNLALLELLQGDLRSGFAHYRARFKKQGRAQRLPYPKPLWRGEDLMGKKILVVGEQGLGDLFMLCRYLPFLKQRGATVVVAVHASAVTLMRSSKFADDVVCVAPDGQGDFDFQTSLFDLPHRFHTTLDTIPADIPYLHLPPLRPALTLATVSGAEIRGLKVGVVWSGRKDFENDRRRTIPLAIFSDLFKVKGVTFFNFTRELKKGEAEIIQSSHVIDLSSKLDDFLVTAQFISQCDLVISCDTAVAHLAGALGKKVWVLLPFAPDWRWLIKREDSPWYPTMRLFRQQQSANWSDVISVVHKELSLLATA